LALALGTPMFGVSVIPGSRALLACFARARTGALAAEKRSPDGEPKVSDMIHNAATWPSSREPVPEIYTGRLPRLTNIGDRHFNRDRLIASQHSELDGVPDANPLKLIGESDNRCTGLPFAPTITSPNVPELASTPRRPAFAAGEPVVVRTRCAGPSGDAGLRPIGHSAITGSLGCSGRIALHVAPHINVGYGTHW
jgi:hypothetical protein